MAPSENIIAGRRASQAWASLRCGNRRGLPRCVSKTRLIFSAQLGNQQTQDTSNIPYDQRTSSGGRKRILRCEKRASDEATVSLTKGQSIRTGQSGATA